MTQREIERTLLRFEGLVIETARQIVAGGVEMEHDDVAQLLRLKVWQAVVNYNARHGRGMTLRRYVFMCLTNKRKDIEQRRPRRYNSSIDDIRGREVATARDGGTLADWFDVRYFSVDSEQVYAPVEDDFELPDTLTAVERRIVELRLDGRLMREIDDELNLSRAQRERVMRSLRDKLADHQPVAVAA